MCDNQEISYHDFVPEVADFRNRLPCNFIFGHINISSFGHKFTFYIRSRWTTLQYLRPNLILVFRNYSLVLGIMFYRDKTSSSGGFIVHFRDDLPHRRLFNSEIN